MFRLALAMKNSWDWEGDPWRPEDLRKKQKQEKTSQYEAESVNDPSAYQREHEVSAARSNAYRKQKLPQQLEKERKLAKLHMQRMRLVCCW